MTPSKKSQLLLIFGIALISINLRTSIASVGPLIPFIREDLDISNGLAGFLTTLSLITFAIFSLFAPSIGKRIGNARAIFLGISLLTVGVIIRVLGGTTLLFVGTALTGIGIVIANVLMIPLFKARIPEKMGLMTAILSTGMSLFAAIASGLSVPLAVDLNLGWRGSLASWSLVMLLALAVWFPQVKLKPKAANLSNEAIKNVWKSTLAWQVTLFMGAQSVMYFTMVTWLPDMLISRGMSPVLAGIALSYAQLISLLGTFFAPNFLIKQKEQTGVIIGVGLAYFLGYGLLFIELDWVAFVSLTIIGIGSGASLSIAYTLISLRTIEDRTTAKLSGMVQSAGYVLAALGPLLFGISLDLIGDWDLLIWFLIIMTAQFLAFGIPAGRNRKI
ncbi:MULTISPECIES: MFS transporter [unclassified Algoriphagus]|uniref:CynX/NimT family MFS transporter n=2 Tax=Algoriphagus TaxID=246875 RepID=UPI000C4D91D0|nr:MULTISPECIES: MFS transporter [unclassified Algoriphagus]MAL13292.1 MFS transporter [Algoriphagus sp.]QYH40099.1 MFS transporter [Algoriphagus sp. NBT04N3]HAH37196.1 MFS transporter [Algoriphagus sp.]HAS57984.1 MFS transporter [Algoriphagus sp.]HCH43287.1 MFS transporter [Algoriphagus sp.]